MHEDLETGYKVRKLNLNDSGDIKTLFEAIMIAVQDAKKHGASLPVPIEWMRYYYLGFCMRTEHLKLENDEYFVILKGNERIAVGNCYSITHPEYYFYPVIIVMYTKPLYEKELPDMYHILGRMLRERGHERVYFHMFYGNPAYKNVRKKKIGDYPRVRPFYSLFEMDVR